MLDRNPLAFLLAGLLVCLCVLAEEPPPLDPDITAADLVGHVKRLASDAWEGRGTGSQGERLASNYIASVFGRLGLDPAGVDGTFFQPVKMSGGFDLGTCAMSLMGSQGAGEVELALNKEWRPFGASASGKVEGEVVFAGYGISAPGLKYDDYAGIDVSGKIVVVFRHAPYGPKSAATALRRHAPFAAKLAQATKRGAIGVVVVNDPRSFPSAKQAKARKQRPRPDTVQRRGVGSAPGPKVPFAHMTLAAARRVFPALLGATPEELEAAIHARGAPASRAGLRRVRMQVELKHKTLTGRNVCGLLRAGAKNASDEIVVVGGHHDHLGRGGPGSLERRPKLRSTIHNGADDNASGTSGVLEVAAYMAARRDHLHRSILFMTFTGEERGLVGSRWFVEHPTVPLDKVVAMINMDMIGRLEGRKLFVGGVKTSPVFLPLLRRVNETLDLGISPGAGGRAPSDNTSFYNKDKPVLFFFTGMHPDYHRPSDDWPKIDGAGMEKVARLAAGVVDELARGTKPVPFTKADKGGFGPPRAVLGISIGPAEGGVAISALVPNAPAARAGLLPGDVIVELAGKPIRDFRSLRAVMRKREIGEQVKVKVLRAGEEIEVAVTLGQG